MPRRVFLPIFLAVWGLSLFPITAWTHGSGRDTSDCHTDRTPGRSLCHQDPLTGLSGSSQQDLLVALQALPTQTAPSSGAPSLTGCRMRPYREDPMQAPSSLIEGGPIPDRGSALPLKPSEARCVENLLKAGRKAVAANKVTQGVLLYLSATDMAPAQAGETYLDLASVLDQASYTQLAITAYRKAWMAHEADYKLRGVKREGTALLTLAKF